MYLEYFGFKELPFNITTGVKYFCEVNNQEEVFFRLFEALENKEWFLTVTGEVGTGKTLLCNRLLEKLDSEKERFTSVYLCGFFDGFLSLYKTFAQELGEAEVQNKDSFALMALINEVLIREYERGKQVILILDEAQTCSDEVLEGIRLISNLETASHKLIQIVLVGQPELIKRLCEPNLRQLKERIVANFVLEKIPSFDAFIRYLRGRLRIAGYAGELENLFAKTVLKQLWLLSEGVPRKINILTHKLLLDTFVNREKVCDFRVLQRVKLRDSGRKKNSLIGVFKNWLRR